MSDSAISTRDSILATVQELIQRDGVNALTMDRVAREAGISKGGLLYYFSPKQQPAKRSAAGLLLWRIEGASAPFAG